MTTFGSRGKRAFWAQRALGSSSKGHEDPSDDKRDFGGSLKGCLDERQMEGVGKFEESSPPCLETVSSAKNWI